MRFQFVPYRLIGLTSIGKATRRDLPDFERPPVVEVSLSVQFEPLMRLRTPHLGLFWSAIRKDFPRAEDRSPLPPSIELFGSPKVDEGLKVEVLQVPPVPRCWYVNASGTELLQLQQDRFIVNWRKTSLAEEYPRYGHVRKIFLSEFAKFDRFVQQEDLGQILFTQCEVTYVNHFFPNELWQRPGQLGEIVTVWTTDYSDSFLSEPEDVRFNIRYLMKDQTQQPIGRLQIGVEPKYEQSPKGPMMLMVMNARLRPSDQSLDGAIQALDEGRRWIVKGFTSITTQNMHKLWGRRDNV